MTHGYSTQTPEGGRGEQGFSMELQGKVALVTGGTRGIGRAIAEAFLAEGASVVVNGRTPAKGEQALREMNAGDRAHFLAGDVKSREGCEALVKGTIERYGKIDILVNNAGGGTGHAPIVDLEDWALEDALKWNLWSTFWCTQYALRDMLPRKWGRIINISSVEGKHGKPGVSIYVMAKHAINGFTKSCAQEVGTQGVTINCICPGAIETDIMKDEGPAAAQAMGLTYQGLLDWFASEAAIKRLNTVEEVAVVAALLASEAGGGMTGTMYSVDGGTAAY
jgi:3-hydroxybutyrate dehydrogenase/3-oxoacyl-[acyl-carrier protein] reductase